MGHRTTRDEKTAPRRIHATDEEWQRIRKSADRAGRSVSAHVVHSALKREAGQANDQVAGAFRLLTESHSALSEIADQQLSLGSALAGFEMLLRLRMIEERLGQVIQRLDSCVDRPGKSS